MSKSVLLSYIFIADVTRVKREVKIEKKPHKNTILSGANSQATEISSATGKKGVLPIIPDKTAFISADHAAFVYSCSVRDFRAQSANHLINSGLQSAEHKSFD